jgi:hypothetical protein
MKNLLTYVVFFSILIFMQGAACGGGDAPADSGLNSVEQIIKGVWFLKSKSDTLYLWDPSDGKMKFASSTIYNSFQGTPYIELKTVKDTKESLLAETKAKDATSAGTNVGDNIPNRMLYVTKLGYWLYDQNIGMLVWNSLHLKLLTATEDKLEIRYSSPVKDSAWTITWKMVR